MTNKILSLGFMLIFLLTSCSKKDDSSPAYSDSPATGQGGSGNQNQPGVITAGEWNDLDHWNFWEELLTKDEFKGMPAYWSFFNKNRIAVVVMGTDSSYVTDALVQLKRGGITLFSARTDNRGSAELWVDLFQYNANVDFSTLEIVVNEGAAVLSTVQPFNQGINKLVVSPAVVANTIEIAFVVDATGSMGDELEYLKTELLDVIGRVKTANPNAAISTSSVFYRDEGDDYVTRLSPFTSDINVTTNFIKNQSAGGGGDFPEAVHTALDKAINELQWATNAKTRLMFLVLDAPPHYDTEVISNLQTSLLTACEKGIKIIPITASGIDKETEFLMRFLSVSTNGTYVFVTDHSGIGNSHLEPSVGQYEVEFLNDLMVRLINKYAL